MRLSVVAAVDIGTQSSRAALVDRAGRIHELASSPLALHAPKPGWAEQDPEQWWSTTVANLSALTVRRPELAVEAVGVGAQMHSLVPVGAGGAPLGARAAIWSDKRCLEQVQELLAQPDAAELSALAGNAPLPAWSGFKMAWLRAHDPRRYAQAAHLLVAKDFLNLRLCGEVATDPSEASGSFLCEAATGRWSPVLLGALGVDRRKLPEIVPASAVIGGVTKDVARLTGLRAGTPVVAGSGDMMCQLLAAGVTGPDRVALVSGTASIVAAAASRAAAEPQVMSLRSASGCWVHFGIGDAAGEALGWFLDSFGPPAGSASRGEAFAALVAEAAEVPAGAAGLRFFPYLLGERTLGSSSSRASFIGATLGHGHPHFARAVLEGVTMEDRRALEAVAGAGLEGAPVRCTGGGSRSAAWNQIRADVFGRPVQAVASPEGGVLGAAVLAGVGAGWYEDPASGAEPLVRLSGSWTPEPGARAIYERAYREFCAGHEALEGLWAGWGSPDNR